MASSPPSARGQGGTPGPPQRSADDSTRGPIRQGPKLRPFQEARPATALKSEVFRNFGFLGPIHLPAQSPFQEAPPATAPKSEVFRNSGYLGCPLVARTAPTGKHGRQRHRNPKFSGTSDFCPARVVLRAGTGRTGLVRTLHMGHAIHAYHATLRRPVHASPHLRASRRRASSGTSRISGPGAVFQHLNRKTSGCSPAPEISARTNRSRGLLRSVEASSWRCGGALEFAPDGGCPHLTNRQKACMLRSAVQGGAQRAPASAPLFAFERGTVALSGTLLVLSFASAGPWPILIPCVPPTRRRAGNPSVALRRLWTFG